MSKTSDLIPIINKCVINYKIKEILLEQLLTKGIHKNYINDIEKFVNVPYLDCGTNGRFSSVLIYGKFYSCVFSEKFYDIDIDECKNITYDVLKQHHIDFIDKTVITICKIIFLQDFYEFNLKFHDYSIFHQNKFNDKKDKIKDNDSFFKIVEKIILSDSSFSYPNNFFFSDLTSGKFLKCNDKFFT